MMMIIITCCNTKKPCILPQSFEVLGEAPHKLHKRQSLKITVWKRHVSCETASYHSSGNSKVVLVQTMRANGEVEVQLHSFLTSRLHVDKGLDSSPSDFTPT